MKPKIVIVALIILLSGCIDSGINGTYVSANNVTIKFIDGGKVLTSGKDDSGKDTAVIEDYQINNNTVILSWLGMAYVLKIQDNGKRLMAADGTNYTKVGS